ncbi:hypothetical protein Cgig2_002382 [Carnegiea gigantea]|uniref:KIB1-4 beta-propeller domain-containing protein n=1 Tax=Carnegiea gigantea TaxID=171969 RepID=A0A9Q1QR38_9CARY|nr:hypothetical protein Cgig2_002382 [Carnegiea gigantea]
MANNCAQIPTDIAAKIAEHIELFYSLSKRTYVKINLPSSIVGTDKDDQTRRYFSSHDWLIMESHNSRSRVTLFDPFSNNVIDPPGLPLHIFPYIDEWKDCMVTSHLGKFVLSTSPSKANDNDYMVAMLFGDLRQLAFWRPRQDTWVKPDSVAFNNGWFHDACFFRGEFYVIDNASKLIAFGDLTTDIQNKLGRPPRVVANLQDLMDFVENGNLYLVEFESCLLALQREVFVKSYKKPKYETTAFKMFKLNVDNGAAERIQSLGNHAIFVGYNSTFVVRASTNINDEHGGRCQADCIYSTDDAFELYHERKGGSDMGIYSLALGKLVHYRHPFCEGPSRLSLVNPPIWVHFSV